MMQLYNLQNLLNNVHDTNIKYGLFVDNKKMKMTSIKKGIHNAQLMLTSQIISNMLHHFKYTLSPIMHK